MEKLKETINYKDYHDKMSPNGGLKRRMHRYDQENYGHFNSVFAKDNDIFILAHNVTSKTRRKSEIYRFNYKRKLINKQEIDGDNCHNIYKTDNNLWVCDSINNRVYDYKSNKIIFECSKFTRGLAISEDYVLIGGSTLSADDTSDRFREGSVYILNRDMTSIGEIAIDNCQINEIRRIDAVDFGLSNSGE